MAALPASSSSLSVSVAPAVSTPASRPAVDRRPNTLQYIQRLGQKFKDFLWKPRSTKSFDPVSADVVNALRSCGMVDDNIKDVLEVLQGRSQRERVNPSLGFGKN